MQDPMPEGRYTKPNWIPEISYTVRKSVEVDAWRELRFM